jgi:hypothetical protein
MPEHNSILPPFADHLNLKRVLARIKVCPKLLYGLRYDVCGKQTMYVEKGKRRNSGS